MTGAGGGRGPMAAACVREGTGRPGVPGDPIYRAWPRMEGYPSRLIDHEETQALWVRSVYPPEEIHQALWRLPAVAIVGARAASESGLAIAREIAWGLARRGVVVVSGLALGIDSAAHDGALLGGGKTIAVQARGLDGVYPAEHACLAARIEQRGALLSEWPEGIPPDPWRFPRRNRLISALADAVVVVEGSARSGALHTVRFAVDQGVDVFTVPRDPALPGSVLPLRLMRDGVRAVTSASDILAFLNDGQAARQLSLPMPGTGSEAAAPGSRPALDGPAREPRPAASAVPSQRECVRTYLHRHRSGTLEAMAAAFPAVSAAQLLGVLIELEIEGEVWSDGRGRWRGNHP